SAACNRKQRKLLCLLVCHSRDMLDRIVTFGSTRTIDLAFFLAIKIQLSVPTHQLFPDSTFPTNFSVMTTVRAVRGSQVFLLSLYDSQGTQQLGLEVGRSPVFLYEDHEGQPPPELYPTFRKINLADGKWHRVAYRVEGQLVTLYLDCDKLDTLDLLRGHDPHISTDGVTVFGTRLLDEDVFEVGMSVCAFTVCVCVCYIIRCGEGQRCLFCVCYCDTGRHPAAADRGRPQRSRAVLSGLHARL
uniref:Collagen alpha-1(XI) chain-like n=1 Tax=Mastacembelus armatus TaxID=205130 RepID=A0A3Q3RV35_9TELE